MNAALWAVHAALTALLAVHSAEYLRLAVHRLRSGRVPAASVAPPVPADAPVVLVQVPIRGDSAELPGCTEALAALEWPRDRLRVQIIDDSDDAGPGAEAVRRLAAAGVEATHVRRPVRTDAKAGALAEGMRRDDAAVLVPMDVDFRPSADLLRHLVVALVVDVACVQARWSTRPAPGPLAWAQRLALAGHFHVEQSVRARHGSLMSFNATACAWRRTAIMEAGGWSGETLTEDLDLATRVLLAGGRFVYLEHVPVPSGLPTTMSAFVRQQARWARGSMQCARIHAGAVWRRPDLPRWQTLFHLFHYTVQPLVLGLFGAQAVLVWTMDVPRWYAATALALVAGPTAMYLVTIRVSPELRARDLLAIIPLAVFGLAAVPRLASEVVAGALGARGRFLVTPKGGRRAPWSGHGAPAAWTSMAVAAWWLLAWPLGDVLAPGVVAFGACTALGALMR